MNTKDGHFAEPAEYPVKCSSIITFVGRVNPTFVLTPVHSTPLRYRRVCKDADQSDDVDCR